MKNLILILNLIIFFSQVSLAQSETAESPNAMQELVNRSQTSNSDNKSIWGGEFEHNQVPALLETFFQDSDCAFDRGTPFDMQMVYVPEANRVNPNSQSSSLVCQMRYGNTLGDKKFKLCQHFSVTCNSIVGGLKKDNIVYPVPEGQSCSSVSAREALLTSFQSNPGDFNVIPGSN